MEINHENSTRCFELYLDESREQTRRIHARQRRSKTLEGQKEEAGKTGLATWYEQVETFREAGDWSR